MTTTRMFQRRGTAAEWAEANTVLGSGEFGYVEDTGAVKIGNGSTPWNSLPSIGGVGPGLSDAEVAALITSGVLTSAAVGDAVDEAVEAHVNDSTPHPAYDDMPSLTLIFENHLI